MKRFKLTPICAAVTGVLVFAPLTAIGQQADGQTLPEIVVKADQERPTHSSAGALGERPLRDTPFSVEVVTASDIADAQATLIDEAFESDPAVASFNNGYIGEASGITIRGLQLDLLNGYKIDGLAVPAWVNDIPLEHFEQIELLKGLSGFMYGFGQPGGIVNYISKRPTAKPKASVMLGYMSDSVFRGHADLGGRFGDDDRFGYRINAVREQGDTFIDNGGYVKRTSLSAAFDARLTRDLLWSIDSLYQKRKVNAAYWAVSFANAGINVPEPISGSRRLAQPFTFHANEFRTIGTELLWSFAPDWNLRASYRNSDQERENADSWISITGNDGSYSESQFRWLNRYRQNQAQVLVSGKFSTGSVGHQLVAGTSVLRQTRDSGSFGFAPLGTGNLANPGLFADPQLALNTDLGPENEITEKALFISDTLEFNKRWSAILGLRHSRFEQENFNRATGALTNRYEKDPITPTVALIYKPIEPLSLYASYVEGLEAGGSAPIGTVNQGEVFGPLRSKQVEIGAKADYQDWGVSAALFRIERGLEYTNAANVFVQDGQVLYQGLELAGRARLARHWLLKGGAMWLDARNTEAAAAVEGKRAQGAARFQLKTQVEYAVPQVHGLTLSGGAQYIGDRPVEADNTHIVGSVVTFDAGARYRSKISGYPVTFRLNVDNLADRAYWVPSWGFAVTQGAPRTVRASVQVDF